MARSAPGVVGTREGWPSYEANFSGVTVMLWVAGLLISTVIGLGIGQLARSRGRSVVAWSVAGVALWPVALVLLLALPSRGAGPTSRWLAPVVLTGVFLASWSLLSLLVSALAIKDFYIPSASMLPTLPVGTYVDVNRLDKGAGRGAIVIFGLPSTLSSPLPFGSSSVRLDVVKRVVAIEGDTISCCRAGHVVLDGRQLEEGYLPPADAGAQARFGPVRVPPGSMFVMGDNREDSADSRTWGPVPTNLIVGRVEGPRGLGARLFPLGLSGAAALILTVVARMALLWRTSGERAHNR